MPRLYRCVGPKEIALAMRPSATRALIREARDVVRWVGKEGVGAQGVTVTFAIGRDGDLWIADRRSEHVACAAAEDVLSAGEMTFRVDGDLVAAVEVTNQSIGYCPAPESYGAVAAALARAGIAGPGEFTAAFTFRKCGRCETTNIVKDAWFVCDVCGADLPMADAGDSMA